MPKGQRNLPIAFEKPYLTHFAGMALIHAFCQRLGLKRLVQRCLRPTPRAREYQVFDLNSVVLVIYGHAEGARVGYNPKKRGRRSYHPLLCF